MGSQILAKMQMPETDDYQLLSPILARGLISAGSPLLYIQFSLVQPFQPQRPARLPSLEIPVDIHRVVTPKVPDRHDSV